LNAGCIDVVLQRDRNAMEGPAPFASARFSFHLPRSLESGIGGDGDECIDGAIQLLDPPQTRLSQFNR